MPAIKLGQGDHATTIRKCMPIQTCIQQEDARVCKRKDLAVYVASVFLGSNKHYIPIWAIEKYLKLPGIRSTLTKRSQPSIARPMPEATLPIAVEF
jgi:hypothetical protein